jgi:alpha-L-fucosidase
MLVLGNGGDGNVLLNVGPTPEGVIAPEQANRLKDVGDWLAKYGESLMETRGGPYKPTTDFACTRKDKAIYLHFLKRSGDVIKLPALSAKIVSAKLLTGGDVKASQSDTELSLTLTPKDPKEIDVVVKLELDKAAMDIAPIDVK